MANDAAERAAALQRMQAAQQEAARLEALRQQIIADRIAREQFKK